MTADYRSEYVSVCCQFLCDCSDATIPGYHLPNLVFGAFHVHDYYTSSKSGEMQWENLTFSLQQSGSLDIALVVPEATIYALRNWGRLILGRVLFHQIPLMGCY